MSRAATEYRYEKLTWPEINDAVDLGKVCIVPCGAVEQHGPHLPLDVDLVCPTGIARGAGQRFPTRCWCCRSSPTATPGHVMDFPGTINNDFEHFMHHVLDITKSLAYHGFKKIILLNGHGSNMPNLDLVARRTNLETDAECVCTAWWQLLTVDKEFLPAGGRASFPAAVPTPASWRRRCICISTATTCARIRSRSGTISFNEEDSPFNWVDLFAAGPSTVVSWTSSYSETGVLGDAELATAEKGRQAYEEAVKQLVRLSPGGKTGPRTAPRPPSPAADDADAVGPGVSPLRTAADWAMVRRSVPVAQLDRASASGAEGYRFESCRGYWPQEAFRLSSCGLLQASLARKRRQSP
jgi:creatinine amidohydrolase